MNTDRKIRSYVLRQGRMSRLQTASYEKLKSVYCVPFIPGKIDFKELFPETGDVIIEIGFGMGTATADIAEKNRDKNYLGIEVHTPGVGKLLSEIEGRRLNNVRIIQHDAAEVIRIMIPDKSIQGFHIFFPDPWPKKKHHKRRLIQHPFTVLLTEKLTDKGYIYMATDWQEYAEQMEKCVSEIKRLLYPVPESDSFKPWRPETKFERKGMSQGHGIYEIFTVKN